MNPNAAHMGARREQKREGGEKRANRELPVNKCSWCTPAPRRVLGHIVCVFRGLFIRKNHSVDGVVGVVSEWK